MNKVLLLSILVLAVSAHTYKPGAYDGPQEEVDGCLGKKNELPLITMNTKTPARQVSNGELYTTDYDGRQFYVANVTGSAYEMGYAQGKLLKQEIHDMIDVFWPWALSYVTTMMRDDPKIPNFLIKIVEPLFIPVVDYLLDLNYYITINYTADRWNQEMLGLSDATGISIWEFRRMNLIPELLKAACSAFGAWDKASATNNLIQLRSLDWEEHAPMSEWPLIVIYHSNEPGSVEAFANIAWPGFIGTLTGYNSQKVGVGERLRGDDNENMTRYGTPWTYVLRDMLQFSKSQPEAIQYLKDADRTCSVYLGVGGGANGGDFNIVKYTAAYCDVYSWFDWDFDERHPMLEDVMWKEYRTKETCFADIIQEHYGQITPELVYRELAPKGRTGDSQVVVFDYEEDVLYCEYPNPVTSEPGYNCPPIKIDMKPFFGKSEN